MSLVGGLIAAAVLLTPWKLKFSLDVAKLYDELYEQAAAEAEADTLGWLGRAATRIRHSVARTRAASPGCLGSAGALGVLMVVQTLSWLAGLGGD